MNRRNLFALFFAPLASRVPARDLSHFRRAELNLRALRGLFRAPDELLKDAAALEPYIRKRFPTMVRFRVRWEESCPWKLSI